MKNFSRKNSGIPELILEFQNSPESTYLSDGIMCVGLTVTGPGHRLGVGFAETKTPSNKFLSNLSVQKNSRRKPPPSVLHSF